MGHESASAGQGRLVAVSLGLSVGLLLPGFLTGSLAVEIREDFPFDASTLGVSLALFYLTSVVTSAPAGRLVERVGPARGMDVATAFGVMSVARRAAVNKQLVYYYFDSKLGLYNAVLGHMIDSARPVFQAKFSRDVFTGASMRRRGAAAAPSASGGTGCSPGRPWKAGVGEIVREEERREAWNVRVTELEESIRDGEVDDCFDPRMLALAILAIQILPRMLPQVTKMITGLMPGDKEFEEAQRRLPGQLAEHLRPDPR